MQHRINTGDFSICHATLPEGSDAWSYRTLRYAYDDEAEAWAAVAEVATEEGVPAEDCVVVQVFERPQPE